MTIQFNKETFRDDYSFRNSDRAIKRFPMPFHEDSYMYSVNMEQHRGGPEGSVYEKRFDVDEHYVSEMEDRAMVLADDPLRCQSLPHMTLAGWDTLELITPSGNLTFNLHDIANRKGEAVAKAPGSGHIVSIPLPEGLGINEDGGHALLMRYR